MQSKVMSFQSTAIQKEIPKAVFKQEFSRKLRQCQIDIPNVGKKKS